MCSYVQYVLVLLACVTMTTVTLNLDGSSGSYVMYPPWKPCLNASLSFMFKTDVSDSLLLYMDQGHDFLEVQLLSGSVRLIVNSRQRKVTTQAGHFLNDNKWHHVSVRQHGALISLKVDDVEVTTPSPGTWQSYGSSSSHEYFLFLGGLPIEYENKFTSLASPSVIFKPKFRGSIGNLFYQNCDGEFLRPTPLELSGTLTKNRGLCEGRMSCLNGGRCLTTDNKGKCDCANTNHRGSRCELSALTLTFDGSQFLKVTKLTELINQVDDISLRFRTVHPTGLLFLITGHMRNRMKLYLDEGVLFLSVDLSSDSKILSVGHKLNNNIWHTVFIKFRMRTIEMTVDQERSVTEQMHESIKQWSIASMEVGHVTQTYKNSKGQHSGFIGSMQDFIVNEKEFFQMAKADVGNNIEISADFISDDYYVEKPVAFMSADSYLILSRLQVHDRFSVTLKLKTTESSGLILYNGGTGQDFFAVELFHGFLFYVYDMGKGPQRLKANTFEPISDNKWHEIQLLRSEMHKQLLIVDDNVTTIDDLTSAKNSKLDLKGHLYVGGVSKKMYPYLSKHIYSKQGFIGCLGSLDLNGYLPDLILEAIRVHDSVEYGCKGPLSMCDTNSCANNGRCVQHWMFHTCDCDMTSFTGPACKDESVSYIFGSQPGLIIYTYPDHMQPSTTLDRLAFGFQTFQDDATLIRIDSKSFDDFIQIEMLGGHIHLTYNMGIVVQHLVNLHQKVNDGRYHVVRVTRTGSNATLQIDSAELHVQNSTTGYHQHIFNEQAVITVGGLQANGSIVRHFEGLLSGLVFNSVQLFELAKQRNPKIHFDGNVFLNVQASFARSMDEGIDDMQAIEEDTEMEEEATDDIIFAGAESGCHYNSDEDCVAVSSGTDDIITAVVIIKITTHAPTTVKQDPKCVNKECETAKLSQLPDFAASTWRSNAGGFIDGDGHLIRGFNGDIYSSQHKIHDELNNSESTEEPGKALGKDNGNGNKGVNLGLILGISVSILIALIVLAIALCKLRSRNEGIYKVDETQNFSSLQSGQSVANGTIASGSDLETSKRGRIKDVKEWYV